MNKFWNDKRVLITGGDGFFGRAVVKKLIDKGVNKSSVIIPKFPQDNLLSFNTCLQFSKDIDIIIHLAAKVGGIMYNKNHPGSMLYENLKMSLNIMEAARVNGVNKIVNIGTTCAYPANSPVPFKESNLWNGYPAKETAPYGLAKKMLLELGKGYKEEYDLNSIFLLPVNLYGPGDHFEGDNTHVIPALISRFVKAKEKHQTKVIIWGSGKATREFLFIDDAADGILLATENYNEPDPINLGTGIETSIKDIVEMISNLVGYSGTIYWDNTKPDGTLRRSVDVRMAEKKIGFHAKTFLKSGLQTTIEYYKNTYGNMD